jgi:hypothetical protein
MSVYVDDIAVCVKNKKWRWPKACHLVADSVDELHKFADRLGLKRSWFQHGTIPHYDLTENMRRKAVKLGAIEIDRDQMVQFIRKNRI